MRADEGTVKCEWRGNNATKYYEMKKKEEEILFAHKYKGQLI